MTAPEIRSQLDRILRSRAFIQSHRIRRFLQFVVEESLLGQHHRLKEYLIGLEVFDRRETFDPRVDSIVRVEARRLRNKLEEYYRAEGREDQLYILLRKGSYIPVFEHRNASGGIGPVPRRTIEVAPLSLLNADSNTSPVAEEIQRRLAHVLIKEGGLQVIARPQPNALPEESNGHSTNGHTHAPAEYVVEGSLEFQGENFHLILQLLQQSDHSYIWSEAACGQCSDLRCVDQLAQSLIHELVFSPSEALVARRQTTGKESRDHYVQGRYYWKLATPDSIQNSVSFFSKAVECDGNYAAAWAALGESLLVSSMFGLLAPQETGERMKEAAHKAASLNASLPEAHVALGSVLSILDWDWAAGEQELEKAIQFDKHDPTGHLAYGIHLACRGLLDSAIGEVEQALELDPASLFPNFVLGWLYGVSRRFEDALAQHQFVSQLAPDYTLPHLGLGLACTGQGRYEDAIAHFTNAHQMKCLSLLRGHLGYCYAKSGRREEALQEIANLSKRSESHYVSPVSFAAIYAGLNDTEQALRQLEQALEVRDTSLAVSLLNPQFDSLQREARFQALRQKLGLRPASAALPA